MEEDPPKQVNNHEEPQEIEIPRNESLIRRPWFWIASLATIGVASSFLLIDFRGGESVQSNIADEETVESETETQEENFEETDSVQPSEPTEPIEDSPKSVLANANECKVPHPGSEFETVRSGFPLHPDYVFEGEQIVIQLIYVDAEGLNPQTTPAQDAPFWSNGAGEFLRDMSGSQIEFVWRFEDQYFELEKPIADYNMLRSKGGDAREFVQAAIDASDAAVDFSDVDIAIAVLPPNVTSAQVDFSPAVPLISDSGFSTDEGNVFRGTLAGSDTRFGEGYLLIAHEIGHLLGLQDYYSHSWQQGMPYEEQFEFMGVFDNMNFAPGDAREWTSWSRWLLGFISDDQVRCITGPGDTTHELTSISDESDSAKMVVIVNGDSEAIVIESRKSQRHDSRLPKEHEGLLVYRVDPSYGNGNGPLRIIRKDNIADPFLSDAPLQEGESISVDGFTITNEVSREDGHRVRVSMEPN